MTEQYVEELIRKYADGTASDEEIQRLMQWYRSASIDEVVWPSSDPAEKESAYRRMYDRLQNDISPKARVARFPWLRVAAILLIVLGSAFSMLHYFKPSTSSFITVTNPSGKIQLVSLPDSSKVWLNALTTLRYRKNFKQIREIELEGEAYFNVTHDATRPFKVGANGLQTRVLGTSFNVKAYKSQTITSVSLITGKVQVSNSSKELALLAPGTQLQFDKHTQKATTIAIDTNAVLAWKKGRLQFQGETFADIASALENWYGIKVIFANPGMRACRYYMNFDNTVSIEKLLSTMAEITEMKYVFDNNRNIVTLSGTECR